MHNEKVEAIHYTVGDCVMPTEGVFARVLLGGTIIAGDLIEMVNQIIDEK